MLVEAPETRERSYTFEEKQLPWLGNLVRLALFEDQNLTFKQLQDEAANLDNGNKYNAWNEVRFRRSSEIIPNDLYSAGSEGYPVGVWTPEQIFEHKIEAGRAFLDGIMRLHRNDGRLRRELSQVMDYQQPKWGIALLRECNTFVTMERARLRVLAPNTRNQAVIAQNEGFREETYRRIGSLPAVKYIYDPENGLVTMRYPLSCREKNDRVKPPMNRIEESLLAYSRAFAAVVPLVRVAIRHIPERPFSGWM